MRFAYADPPYLGLAVQFYGEEAAEYDTVEGHINLIDRLETDYDGWAMSLHTPSLRTILPLCPADVRVCAWVKPFASFKPGVNPAYAWEPVLLRGGRQRGRGVTVRDWTAVSIALERGFRGAKPAGLAFWLFEVAGLTPEDEFVDLFPGSGGVGRAWESWCLQGRLPLGEIVDESEGMLE